MTVGATGGSYSSIPRIRSNHLTSLPYIVASAAVSCSLERRSGRQVHLPPEGTRIQIQFTSINNESRLPDRRWVEDESVRYSHDSIKKVYPAETAVAAKMPVRISSEVPNRWDTKACIPGYEKLIRGVSGGNEGVVVGGNWKLGDIVHYTVMYIHCNGNPRTR